MLKITCVCVCECETVTLAPDQCFRADHTHDCGINIARGVHLLNDFLWSDFLGPSELVQVERRYRCQRRVSAK